MTTIILFLVFRSLDLESYKEVEIDVKLANISKTVAMLCFHVIFCEPQSCVQ